MADRFVAPLARPSAEREGWQPAVDGLRGLAVLAVLLYHAAPDVVPGGYLGVSLFFTLSGYLITGLLLREHHASGRVDVPRFWIRRARRLAPVALAGLGLALAVAWATGSSGGLGAVAADVRYAAANLANWHQLGGGRDYGDALVAPSPVTHYWSLAIEEQFYVVYPLVAALALRSGRRALGAVLVFATTASLGAQLLAATTNRAYLGTDARLAEITIGALLALVLASRPRRPRAGWEGAGALGLAAIAAAWFLVPLEDVRITGGGLVAHALVASVVIVAVVRRGWLARRLSWGPLVSLGLLSYGVYVVHFPLFLWLTPERAHLDGLALAVLRCLASFALAAGLHALIERPVRWGGSLPGWQGGLGWLTATTAVVLVGIALPHVPRSAESRDVLALGREEPTVVTMPSPPPTAPAASNTTSVTADAVTEPVGPGTTAPTAPGTGGGGPTPPVVPRRALRLLVVGDSTAAATGLGLQQWARETGAAAVDVVSGPGCAFEQSGVAVIRDGWERSAPPACLELLASARTVAARHPPDAVIVLIGSIQLADWRVGAAPVQAIGDPGFDARYSGTASSALSTLESLGAPVLWATLPVPAWEPSKQFTGYEPPGSGPLTINDAGRTARLNHLNRNLVGAHPLVRLFPYADLLIGPGGQVSNDLRPDGMHLDPDLVPELMQDRMEEALRAAYRDVVRARPEIALPGSPWSS